MVVVVVTAGSLVRFTPPGRRRRLHFLLLSGPRQSLLLLVGDVGEGRPDGQLPLNTGAGVGAVQGAVPAVSAETVAAD